MKEHRRIQGQNDTGWSKGPMEQGGIGTQIPSRIFVGKKKESEGEVQVIKSLKWLQVMLSHFLNDVQSFGVVNSSHTRMKQKRKDQKLENTVALTQHLKRTIGARVSKCQSFQRK